MKVKLSKPLQISANKSISELDLKDITLQMVIEIGEYPFSVSTSGEIKPLPGVMARYLAMSSGIELAIIRQMAIIDFLQASQFVTSFFGTGASATA